jgi:hypothetical protein
MFLGLSHPWILPMNYSGLSKGIIKTINHFLVDTVSRYPVGDEGWKVFIDGQELVKGIHTVRVGHGCPTSSLAYVSRADADELARKRKRKTL